MMNDDDRSIDCRRKEEEEGLRNFENVWNFFIIWKAEADDDEESQGDDDLRCMLVMCGNLCVCFMTFLHRNSKVRQHITMYSSRVSCRNTYEILKYVNQ